MTPTALYRLYDANGSLLYVGISSDPSKRFREHRSASQWWPLVASRRVEWLRHRPAAQQAERKAIEAESPAWNVVFTAKAAQQNKQSRAAQASIPLRRAPKARAPRDQEGPAHELVAEFDREIQRIEAIKREAMMRRNRRLREFQAETGWTQADMVRATGYTRETIRQALNPEIREAVKARRAAKRKGAAPGG